MLLLHSLSGLVVQWFSVTGKETKGESGSVYGRATWLVHDRRENKQHCFGASLGRDHWVLCTGGHLGRGQTLPFPQHDEASRSSDIYKRYGY